MKPLYALLILITVSLQAAALTQPSGKGLSPEILAMKDGQTIAPELYRKYSSDIIAQSLILRLHRTREPLENRVHPVYDYMSQSMIQLKFNITSFYYIAREGFLNQHATGTSSAYLDSLTRARVEDSLIGVHLEAKYRKGQTEANSLRPKYAYLTFPRNSDGQQRDDFVPSYGNVVAVFKDEVKKRATFTAVDSLNGNSKVVGAAGAYTLYRRSLSRLSKIKDPNGTDYWEAQIWGRLTVQDDVDYFLIECPGDDEIEKQDLDQLKASKIPIYQCVEARDHSHYGKGAQIL